MFIWFYLFILFYAPMNYFIPIIIIIFFFFCKFLQWILIFTEVLVRKYKVYDVAILIFILIILYS